MKRLMMAICALAALSASAETRMWLANVDGDWNTPGMWSGSAVPGSGDTADFSNLTGDKTINLPAAVTVAGIVYSPTVGATTNKLTLAGATLSVGTSVTVGEKAQLRTTCDVKATANIYTYGSGEWVVAKTLKGNSNGRKLYQREGRITLASGATMGYGINLYPGTTDATLPPAEFVVEEGATADFDNVSAFQFAEAENSRFVFTMNGGTLLPRNATSSGCVLNGKGSCGHGVMNINGGLVDGTGKGFWISYYGTGVVNQTAGKMIWKSVTANYATTAYATYNLTGGELWFAGNFERGKSEYAHPYLNVGDAKIVKTGTGTLAVSSPLTIAERFEVDVTNADYTCNISCTMSGQGGLVKTGPGVLNLYSAEKKFAGPLVVSNGTLQVNANMSGSNAVTVAGGTLRAYNKSYVFGSLTICGTGTLLTTNTATFKLPLDANLVTVEDDGVLVLGKGRNPFVTNPALQINGNGKVRIPAGAAQWFPSVKKGAGNIPDGIYTSSTCDVVDGDGTLVVGNCVWSGTAGNGLWTTAANWQDGATPFTAMAGADLSAATGTLTLDAAVTNAALVYAPAAGNVLTNRSDVVLSLGESSVITVGTGSTLVLDGDTCLLNGTIYKRGGGTLVLARKLTAGASSTVYLRVQEGRCVVDGVVERLAQRGPVERERAYGDAGDCVRPEQQSFRIHVLGRSRQRRQHRSRARQRPLHAAGRHGSPRAVFHDGGHPGAGAFGADGGDGNLSSGGRRVRDSKWQGSGAGH